MKILALILPIFATLHVSCQDNAVAPVVDPPEEEKKPRVLTTFYPIQYFAQRIAQDAAEVICPVPETADPIYWMPDASAIQLYQNADLILINGANFERWIEKVALPASKVVNTAQPLENDLLRYESAVLHKHGPEGEHSHEGIDGHTWIDPKNALIQADEIKAALGKRWPEHVSTFAAGYGGLAEDLGELDTRFQTFAASWANRPLAASHPAYNYLAKRYGLKIINLDLDPESVPDATVIELIRRVATEHQVAHLLWETQPTKDVEEVIRRAGMQNVLLAPCETNPATGDYLSAMRENLGRLEALLEKG